MNGISKTAVREENDFYATHPKAMYYLLNHESFNKNIWECACECACGEGNLSKVLKEYGLRVDDLGKRRIWTNRIKMDL